MSTSDWVLAGLVAWAVLSVPVALWFGRAIRLADERQRTAAPTRSSGKHARPE